MKTAIALLVCLFAASLALTPTKGEDIVKQLQGIELDGEVFVIFFYDPQCCADPDRTFNEDIKKEIQEKILSTDKGKKYIFYEIDTSATEMEEVLDLLNIDKYQTKHGPTVLIACSGTGYWSHGRPAVDEVVKKMSQYDAIKEDALRKIAARDELIN